MKVEQDLKNASSLESLLTEDFLLGLADSEIVQLRAAVDIEMRRRRIALSVGQMGEQLAIGYFNRTAGNPNLSPAPPGTANVDALSRRGERYSIKTICNAKKTGTIYPHPDDKERQLFEYLLVVKMAKDWTLEAIYEFDWKAFVACRRWDKRMNAWYIGAAKATLDTAKKYVLDR
jgi:hypothetical protein